MLPKAADLRHLRQGPPPFIARRTSQLPKCTCQMNRNRGNAHSSGYRHLCQQGQDHITHPNAETGAQLDRVLWFLPLGPATTTSRGATPALLVSTVKDWGILARTAVPRPGPAIFTLLGSTTSFTGTLKGLPAN